MDKVIEDLYARYSANGVVSTDTRNIAPGSIFFALKGDKYNANEFALEALEKGASCVVIDEEKYAQDDRFILVENGLAALQDLARYHRSLLQIPVIGLTGSNGKTTTKELMHAVLSRKYNTVATKGNLNNHIGVPLTLLSIDTTAEMAVIEMGANHPGEIAMLCKIADPTHGLITNIGRAHIGTFGGFENIVKAKAALYQHLVSRQGVAFVNSMNPLLTGLAKPIARKVTYPSAGDSYHCDLVNADPLITIMADNGDEVQTKLIGAYNLENIACALCVGKFFGVEARLANQAVAEYDPGNMRSQIVKRNTNTIILDAYNANPSSMQAAIENMARINAKNKVLILGDMFELEDEADREHRAIGKLIREKGFENVYLCGNLFKTALHEIPYAKYFVKKGELEEELKQYPISNATVLIKASRGIGLETVVEYL